VQHLAEGFAGLISEIEPLAELCASRSINSANVLDVCVDARAERCALGQRRDAAWCWDLHDAEDVDDDELDANSEEHGWCGHGEDTDGGVVRACAAVMH